MISGERALSMILDTNQLSVENILIERNYRLLFKNLTFHLKPRDIFVITGKNGSGKSTLLRCLAGFIQPKHGNVLWQNNDIYKNLIFYQQNLEYMGHKNGLYSSWSVWDNLRNLYKKDVAEESLSYWKLDQVKNHNVNILSAGQKRRLALAKLYCSEKNLFFLDEPVTSLDYEGKELFFDWIRYRSEKGHSAIIALHDIEVKKFPWPHIHLLNEDEGDV